MPYNGSGVFAHDGADYPAVADTVIDATKRNNIDSDIATGLSTAITKDGQTTITANLPMATYRHTGVGNGVARTDYAAMGQVQDGKVNWLDGAGTADAITAVYSPAITALVDGQICFVRATAANATTTPTFAPNGLTARTIVQRGGQALVAGNIAGDGHELILRYDLTNTRWELLNPAITPTTLGTTDVAHGGTGRTTSTTAYGLIAAGTTATGAHQTLAAGATTEILVGGGAAALPVWTAATGTGAPVRANSPALVTPTGIVKGDVGLGNVENTALSTWGGSGNIVQVGTITVGTWTADAINAQYGGTGVTTFTIGDIMYAATTSGTPTQWSKLAGNTTTTLKALTQTGTGSVSAAPVWNAIRELLTAARTYYVRTDGSDSNNGLADTAGGAFLTIQAAVNAASALDNGGYDVTIQVRDGTYAEDVSFKTIVGAGSLIVQGNSVTPANVITKTFAGASVIGNYTVKDLVLTNGSVAARLSVSGRGCVVSFSTVTFGGTTSTQHIGASDGGVAKATGNYTISASTSRHAYSATGGSIEIRSKTVTLSGTPAWTTGFAHAEILGQQLLDGNTFSGAATGPRYNASLNSVLYTAGGGATYLPGDSAGSTATGGQYN